MGVDSMTQDQKNDSIALLPLMGVAALAAVVAGGVQMALSSESSGAAASPSAVVVANEGQRVDLGVTADHRSRGAKAPQAQLVVFGDFASPFAATAGRVVDTLLGQYPEQLTVAYRHFVNTENHTSKSSAVAAEAAAKLGKLAVFRQLAFGRNDGLGYVDFSAWAGSLGVDDTAYRSAMADAATLQAVENDGKQADALGLNRRPTFYLNGVQVPGTTPAAALATLIDQELKAGQEAGGLKALLKTEPFDLEGVDTGTLEQKKEGEARFGENKVRITDNDPSWGKPDAKVTIVEFGDFLCPYCKRGAAALRQLKTKYGEDNLRIVFKNLPLKMHRYADASARAVLAAGRQGKFWSMHKLLYERQKDVKSGGVDAILGLALELGLDLDLLMDDMTSVLVRQQVADDMSEAARMGVRFTPNYFINDEHIGGALPYNNFVQIVDKHLAKAGN